MMYMRILLVLSHAKVLRPKYSWNPMGFRNGGAAARNLLRFGDTIRALFYIDITIGRSIYDKCLTLFFFEKREILRARVGPIRKL